MAESTALIGTRKGLFTLTIDDGDLSLSEPEFLGAPVTIAVRDPRDGLYRKYRFVAARDYGVPRHLIVSRHWEVHARQRVHNS